MGEQAQTPTGTVASGMGMALVLRLLPQLAPDDLDGLLTAARESAPWVASASVFLSDYQERVLLALGRHAARDPTKLVNVEGTLAGRAFLAQEPVSEADGRVWWVPLTNRWRRLGVLRLDVVPGAGVGGADVAAAAVDLASLLATVIDSASRCTDAFYRGKRREPITLTAEMQWELLPPMCIAGSGVTFAGRLEPAYEVGGDSFDYSIDAQTGHVGIFDPLGHDLRAALLAALAVGTYRHARRSLTPLAGIGKQIDDAVRAEFPDSCFVTGLLGELNVESGMFCWTNAGHPLPLLLRDGHVHHLIGAPDRPWGLRHRRSVVERVNLQPRDRVLLHTDGIVEARSPSGESFGADRLADLLVRESLAGRAAPELLRRVLDAVMEHRSAALQDDATAVLIEWRGPEEPPSLGG